MRIRTVIWLTALAAAFFSSTNASAQGLDEDDYPPGLLTRIQQGEFSVSRVDADVAFDWREGIPDSRLSAGKFSATWTGNVLLRKQGRYRFLAHTAGSVRILIDDKVVLDDSSASTGWLSGEAVDLSFGEHALKVEYQSPPDGRGSLRLLWSSNAFETEPVPGNLLFRNDPHAELKQQRQGAAEYVEFRCANCHADPFHQSITQPGPDLSKLRDAISPRWLVGQIAGHAAGNTRMPQFKMSQQDAADIAGWLLKAGSSPKLETPPRPGKDEDTTALGNELLHSVGCLACHKVNALGNDGEFSGPNLSAAGQKRSREWIYTWLGNPAKLNAAHSMPVFALSKNERRQLADAISILKDDAGGSTTNSLPAPSKSKEGIERGRVLAGQLGCANCHELPTKDLARQTGPDLFAGDSDWQTGCVAAKRAVPYQPLYSQANGDAIRAYISSFASRPKRPTISDRGEFLLRQKGCVACHARNQHPGIVSTAGRISKWLPALRGQSQVLIPPALNAVGDKLQDQALARAIQGAPKSPRLPWLKVRMPKFSHSETDLRAMTEYLIAHDRIPADAPHSPGTDTQKTAAQNSASQSPVDGLLIGHTLSGPRGLSCTACHVLGKYKPGKIALGTRGSDLVGIGQRMRRDYFLRWTRSPIRIVPGMEMPSFDRAVPGILDDNIESQLAVLWDSLNDPQFVPPTNPSVVEQFFDVKPNQPPRVVRDVFTNPKANGGGYIARAMAVGYGNGHSLLFDLDKLKVRGWYFGDFARQRTEGKSWFWDMAGLPVMDGFADGSDFVLAAKDNPSEWIRPLNKNGTSGKLLDYKTSDAGFECRYEINFQTGERIQPIVVTERWDIRQSGGMVRSIFAVVPAGLDLFVLHPNTKPRLGTGTKIAAAWTTVSSESNSMRVVKLGETNSSRGNMSTAQLTYETTVTRPPGDIKPLPALRAAAGNITTVPGYIGQRLPISPSIMPTAITWTSSGQLAFTSLKGHVYIAHDSDGDGLEDKLTVFEEGLAAPFGIIADGDSLIVAHKPELIRLTDTNGDGRADQRQVIATGWGYTDNYHDWTCGIVRDSKNNLYVGLGSDYAQKKRPRDKARWRGAVLKVSPDGNVEAVGKSFRYPVGLGINSQDQVFVTDNQGVQNTFNEINLLQPGRHYGVPSRYEPNPDARRNSSRD